MEPIRLRHRPPARLAGNGDQNFVAMLGNVDAYQNTGIRSMLNLGHSRTPQWCSPQDHHKDPSPGYDRCQRDLRAPRAATTFNGEPFPTSYGTEFVSRDLDLWACANDVRPHSAIGYKVPSALRYPGGDASPSPQGREIPAPGGPKVGLRAILVAVFF